MIEAHLCTESDVAFAPHSLFESTEGGACSFESRLDLRLERAVVAHNAAEVCEAFDD